jgi:3-oxoacyl-[acyl-carrier protein] reductase
MSVAIDLSDRVAVVTGATRGIGLAIAERLAEAGASVIGTGTSDSPGDGLAALRDRGLSVRYRSLDLGADESLASFCEQVSSMDRLDVLVNNAGVNRIAPVHEVTAGDYDELHRIDLRGPLLLCGAVIPVMRRGGWGRIVNIASIWATITKPGRAMYTASKFGLVGLTKTLAVENATHGILANAVSPGFTLTELTRSTLSEGEIAELADQVPARRFAEPVEMANVVAFLCSPLNSYLTAQNVTVDGGFTSI